MKKVIYLVGLFALLTLTSCAKLQVRFCKHEWEVLDSKINEDVEITIYECKKCESLKKDEQIILKSSYNCVVSEGEDLLIESLENKYYAGEKIEVKTRVIYDADIVVYVNGNKISRTHFDSDYWGYEFVMPEEDVIIELDVDGSKDFYFYLDSLYSWVNEINIENVIEVAREEAAIGVAPGSFTNIVYSTLEDDIKKAFAVLQSPLVQVSVGNEIAPGGKYVEYTFKTLTKEYSLYINNGNIYCNGQYYTIINELTEFDNSLPIYHSFISYDNTYKVYEKNDVLISEQIGIDKYIFIESYDEVVIDVTKSIGYFITEFGKMYIFDSNTFLLYKEDGGYQRYEAYDIVRGDNFGKLYDLIDEIPIVGPEIQLNYVFIINHYLDNFNLDSLTLSDEKVINFIYEMYHSLEYNKKKEIKEENIKKLNDAINKLNELKNYINFNIDADQVSEIEITLSGAFNILLTDEKTINNFINQINTISYIKLDDALLADCIHNVPTYLYNYIRIDNDHYFFHDASKGFYTNNGDYVFVKNDFTFVYDYALIKDNYMNLNIEDLELTKIEKNGREIMNLSSNQFEKIHDKFCDVSYIFKKIEYFDSYYDYSKDLDFVDYKFTFSNQLFIYYDGSNHFEIYDLVTNSVIYAYCANKSLNNIAKNYLDKNIYFNAENYQTYQMENVNLFEYTKDGKVVQLKNIICENGIHYDQNIYLENLYDNVTSESFDSIKPIIPGDTVNFEINFYAYQLVKLLTSLTYEKNDSFNSSGYLEIQMLEYTSTIVSGATLFRKLGKLFYNDKTGKIAIEVPYNYQRVYSLYDPILKYSYGTCYIETILSDVEQEMLENYLNLISPIPKYKIEETYLDKNSIGVVIEFASTNTEDEILREQYKKINQEYIDKYNIDDYFDILLISEVDNKIVFYIDYDKFNDFSKTYLDYLADQKDVVKVIIEYYPDNVTYVPNPYYFECNPKEQSIMDQITITENKITTYDPSKENNAIFRTYDELKAYCDNRLNDALNKYNNNSYMIDTLKESNKYLLELYDTEYFENNVLVITHYIFSPVCNEILEVFEVIATESNLNIFVKITTPSIGLTAIKETSFILEIPKGLLSDKITSEAINLIY